MWFYFHVSKIFRSNHLFCINKKKSKARALELEWHKRIQKSWVQRGFKFADQFIQLFLKKCMKMKEFGLKGRFEHPLPHPNHMALIDRQKSMEKIGYKLDFATSNLNFATGQFTCLVGDICALNTVGHMSYAWKCCFFFFVFFLILLFMCMAAILVMWPQLPR